MPDFTISPIDDMEAVVFGSFKRARAVLGVESFGMQVIDLPPNAEQYPEHDHAESGQEEVFVVLRGGGEIEIDGERLALNPDTMIRVGPQPKRKIWPGERRHARARFRRLPRQALRGARGDEARRAGPGAGIGQRRRAAPATPRGRRVPRARPDYATHGRSQCSSSGTDRDSMGVARMSCTPTGPSNEEEHYA